VHERGGEEKRTRKLQRRENNRNEITHTNSVRAAKSQTENRQIR
jgi:hypothetical protein